MKEGFLGWKRLGLGVGVGLVLGKEDKVVWHLEQKSRVVYIEILICTYSEQLSLTIFPSLIANTHIAATGFYVQGLANVLDLNVFISSTYQTFLSKMDPVGKLNTT